MSLEQEIKLPFPSVDAARRAVVGAGARLVAERRLLDDQLFDTPDGVLRHTGRALRVRRDGPRTDFTVKGPVREGAVKIREELESSAESAEVLSQQLRLLGYVPSFRSQKYREEYTLGDARLAVDDTPMGTFVEIEATPDDIARIAERLGRGPRDYVLESYVTLWNAWCVAHGLGQRDMVY